MFAFLKQISKYDVTILKEPCIKMKASDAEQFKFLLTLIFLLTEPKCNLFIRVKHCFPDSI